MPTDTCGSTDTTTGEPCGFPVPQPECPFHGEGESPDNGRESIYTEDTASYLLRMIRDGRSVKEVCRLNEDQDDFPSPATVFRWVKNDRSGFADRYARACEVRLDVLAEELLEISDDGRNDTYTDEDGYERTNYDVIQRSKLRVDTRKWLLSKLKPDKYGKRQRVEHSGPEGGPIPTDINIKLVEPDADDGG